MKVLGQVEFLMYRYRRAETSDDDPALVVFLWAGNWEYKLVYLRYIIQESRPRTAGIMARYIIQRNEFTAGIPRSDPPLVRQDLQYSTVHRLRSYGL
jgi:hypothetical protein